MNAPLRLAPADERAEAEALGQQEPEIGYLPFDALADSNDAEDDLRNTEEDE